MDKNKKSTLYIFCAIVFSAILFAGFKFLADRSYRSGIPDIPYTHSLQSSLIEQIIEANKKASRNPSSNNLGNLGMVYHSCAYYDKAAQCYDLAIRRKKDSWIWSYYLGYLNLELGELEKSIANFRNVTSLKKDVDLAWFYTGEAFKNIGMTDSAEIVFKAISRPANSIVKVPDPSISTSFPLNVYARFNLARIYMDSGRYDESEYVLKEITESHMMFGPAYRLLGNLYLKQGELAQGNKYLTRANDLADYMPPTDTIIDRIALISRSEIYLIKQIDVAIRRLNPQWAIDLLNSTKDFLPDNKFLISKAIKLYLWTGYGDQALYFLERHHRAFIDDFDELMELAELLYDNGFQSEAMAYFYDARKLKINEPAVQARLALWLSDRGKDKEAVSLITEQIEKAEGNIMVLSRGVYIFMKVGDKKKAEQLIGTLEKIAPSDTEVLRIAGMMAEDDGRVEEAVALYKRSLAADPGDLATIQSLGSVYMRKKMWKEAIALFRRSLDFHPNSPFLLEGLGKLLVSCPDTALRNINEGLEYSERAFIRSTSPPAIQISAGSYLASAYAGLGHFNKARYFMNITLNMARRNRFPEDYLKYLENLLKSFSYSN